MIKQYPVDTKACLALAQTLTSHIPNGTPMLTAELSTLIAYCMIAEGVRKFPERTRVARAVTIAIRTASTMCALIEEIGAQSDAEFTLTSTAPANKIPA